jgi:tRNA (guanine-N(7)-)-methyltransferase subunit TRM82
MAKMRMPYQCMEKCGNFLVAARGSNIDLFSFTDGSFLSTWQCPPNQEPSRARPATQEVKPTLENEHSKTSSVDIVIEASAPPAKRRKVSEEDQDGNSANDQKEDNKGGNKKNKKQNSRSESVASGLEAPAVIALAVTSDAAHVIAITGEDKSIRVFSVISQDGVAQLQQLSQRQGSLRCCPKNLLIKSQSNAQTPLRARHNRRQHHNP